MPNFVVQGDIGLPVEGYWHTREGARKHALALLRKWSSGQTDHEILCYQSALNPDVDVCVIRTYGEEWSEPRLFVQSVKGRQIQKAKEVEARHQAREATKGARR